MSEENVEIIQGSRRMFFFLVAVLWIRRTLAVLGALALTLWTEGGDSWFEDPLPERLIVFLVGIGLGTAVLVCTGVLRLGSSRLSEDQRAHVRDQMFHHLEAAGLSE